MGYISSTVINGQTYNYKDSEARSSIASIMAAITMSVVNEVLYYGSGQQNDNGEGNNNTDHNTPTEDIPGQDRP